MKAPEHPAERARRAEHIYTKRRILSHDLQVLLREFFERITDYEPILTTNWQAWNEDGSVDLHIEATTVYDGDVYIDAKITPAMSHRKGITGQGINQVAPWE